MMNTSVSSLQRSRALGASRARLEVCAVHSWGTPQPDPFDRHSSERDKQAAPWQRANVRKGPMFTSPQRRRGRSALLRSPDDSPLRDGNRDRLIGLLTERAAKTLLVYLQETNPTVYHWLFLYLKSYPIPVVGTWDEVSGEMFLRRMLQSPLETAKFNLGRDDMFDNIASQDVDPRQIAQRIMEIRVQLSKEFIQDLGLLAEENSVLLRETLQVSLSNTLAAEPIKELPPRDTSKVFVHPELLVPAAGGTGVTLHPEVAESHPELLPVVKDRAARGLDPPLTPKPAAGAVTTARVQTDAKPAQVTGAAAPPPTPAPDRSQPPTTTSQLGAADQQPPRPAPDSHPNSRPRFNRNKPWDRRDVKGFSNPDNM